MDVGGGALTVRCTDYDTEASGVVSCDGIADGSAMVPAKALLALIDRLPGGAVVSMHTTGASDAFSDAALVIEAGRARYTLRASGATFPDATASPTMDAGCSAPGLLAALDMVAGAVSQDDSRPAIGCVLWDRGRMVSTDGHRLHMVEREELDVLRASVLVHRGGLALLRALCEFAGDGALLVGVDARRLRAEFGGLAISVRRIEASFPDYSKVVPEWGCAAAKTVQLPRDGLLAELARVALMADGGDVAVRLAVSGDALSLDVTSLRGEGHAEVVLDPAAQPWGPLGFNPRYLREALVACDHDGVCEMQVVDSFSPALVRDGRGFQAVLMPMRL
jgi:DNA polymerase-3 subunit beta